MSFSLSRAISGAGGFIADTAENAIKTEQNKRAQMELFRLREQLEGERQMRLQEHRQRFEASQQELDREFRASESEKTRAHQVEQEGRRFAFEAGQKDADRALRREEMEQTRRYQGAQLALQRDQLLAPHLVPQPDGTIMQFRKTKDGYQAIGPLTDKDGKVIVGQKDLSPRDKLQIESINKEIEAILKKDLRSPQDEERLSRLGEERARLFGVSERPQPAAEPTAADVARLRELRNNPEAIAAFNARFGAGAAQRVLGGETAPAGGGGIVSSRMTTPPPQRSYGPMTLQSIVERDAAAGVKAAQDELRRRAERAARQALEEAEYGPGFGRAAP